ncbi:MAG: NAD(P)H-quinone oxidoreductase [Candidatus Binataceae bacterium]
MKAVIAERPGDESVLKIAEVLDPVPSARELLIRVRAAGVNRADLLQRQGFYPPPPGASEIIGLECAGEVISAGAEVSGWKAGDCAMALLAGGGYAEKAAVHFGSAMKIPAALGDDEAAAFPEVFLTAFLNIFQLARAQKGDTVLVHGGGSGVGTAAILLLKESGIRSIVTAGSDEKCNSCLKLGADIAINYNKGPFAPHVKSVTNGRGVDVVLDHIGADYLAQNLESLAQGGRLVLIGAMKGTRGEIDLMPVLRRHLTIVGSTLRSRPVEEKAQIVSAFLQRFGAALEAGRLRPPIYRALPAAEAAEAHRMMQRSEHFGKIVLRFG